MTYGRGPDYSLLAPPQKHEGWRDNRLFAQDTKRPGLVSDEGGSTRIDSCTKVRHEQKREQHEPRACENLHNLAVSARPTWGIGTALLYGCSVTCTSVAVLSGSGLALMSFSSRGHRPRAPASTAPAGSSRPGSRVHRRVKVET